MPHRPLRSGGLPRPEQLNFLDLVSAPTEVTLPPTIFELPTLFPFPFVSGPERSREAKKLGFTGELLTLAEVTLHGFEAYATAESYGFDIRVVWHGLSWRIQVKTVSLPVNGFYTVNLERGYRNSPQGRRGYDPDAFDMVAVVILELRTVIFTRQRGPQIRISSQDALRARDMNDSFITTFFEMLRDPDFADIPDRAATVDALEAQWHRKKGSRLKEEAAGPIAAPPQEMAGGSARSAGLFERIGQSPEYDGAFLDPPGWDDGDLIDLAEWEVSGTI